MTPKTIRRGFTLVELLVVIAIIAVLAVLMTGFVKRGMDKAKKVQALAQFRDVTIGLQMVEGDYQRIPIPETKRNDGYDTIYGDPGGNYSNDFIVSLLMGEDKNFPYDGGAFRTKDVNPRLEQYIQFPPAKEKRNGVGTDGKLYDPWGAEIMVGINGLKAADMDLVDFNNGSSDRRLHTWGLAEYTDTKPGEQSYVCWSYGGDKKKGKNGPSYGSVVPYSGSDDAISW